MKIRIKIGPLSLDAELNDTPTAKEVAKVIPLKTPFNTWGEEIYFEIPVYLDIAEDARETVDMGHLGYWPSGHAFCIFFGRTPASRGDECRAASAVNAVGKIEGDPANQ